MLFQLSCFDSLHCYWIVLGNNNLIKSENTNKLLSLGPSQPIPGRLSATANVHTDDYFDDENDVILSVFESWIMFVGWIYVVLQ